MTGIFGITHNAPAPVKGWRKALDLLLPSRVCWFTLLLIVTTPMAFSDEPHGVILLYHRVSDGGAASTRVTPETFAEHLDYIADNGYTVVPLMTLLDGIYHQSPLPNKPVAITFDDGYRSVAEIAYPLLAERSMPFTVFIATGSVDLGSSQYIDWPTLKSMAEDPLVRFGSHSLSHQHLENAPLGNGNDSAQGTRVWEMRESLEYLRRELEDAVIDVFAYPFGEYSLETEALSKDYFSFALAQQSGAVGAATVKTRIPRFPMATGSDSIERLRTALEARPLTTSSEQPTAVVVGAPDEKNHVLSPPPAHWQVTFDAGSYNPAQLQCYAATGERLDLQWQGERLRVSLPPLTAGRNKVNCTAPARNGDGYFWYSRLWLMKDDQGDWLRY